MDDRIREGFLIGVLITLLGMFTIWVGTFNVVKITTDGRYYISTHGNIYELKSDKPMQLTTGLEEEN